jgi:hypothetical protein
MMENGEVDIRVQVFLTSTLVGDEWLDSRPCRFTPGEGAHWIGSWVHPRADLGDMWK